MIYEFNYFFDWGSGTCLWSVNDVAVQKYDYPVDIERLPLSAVLKEALLFLIEKHDEALNWDNPAGDLLWSLEQQNAFIAEAKEAYILLCAELGNDYHINLKEDFACFKEAVSG